MKKEQLKNYIMQYNGYATSVNTHVTPTKGVNSGCHGRLFELLIKLALKNYRFNGVSNPKRADTMKKIDGERLKIEIKTAAGELVSYDCLGDVASDVRNADMVIYAPAYFPVMTNDCDEAVENAVSQAYIMDAKTFYDMLENNGLTRFKRSTASYGDFYFSDLEYDRITIKSFQNSNKMESKLYDLLDENAMPLASWLKEKGLK